VRLACGLGDAVVRETREVSRVDMSSRRMEGGSAGRDKRWFWINYPGRASAGEHEKRPRELRTRVHVAPPEHIRGGKPPILRATTTR
jgi:hypothetical protein